MTTHVSDLSPHDQRCSPLQWKGSHADLSRNESQAMIHPVILNLSVRIHRRIALMEASSVGPAHGPDDFAALAWIQRSLEDVEATIIGLSEANRRGSSAFGGLALLPEACSPTFRPARPAAASTAPTDHAGDYLLLSFHATGIVRGHSTDQP